MNEKEKLIRIKKYLLGDKEIASQKLKIKNVDQFREEVIEKLSKKDKWIKANFFRNKNTKNLGKLLKKNNPPDLGSYDPDKNRIVDIEINDDGSGHLDGVVVAEGVNDWRYRKLYGISIPSDEELAQLEAKLLKEGKLKEVSERTIPIHKNRDHWQKMNEMIKNNKLKVRWF